MTEDASKLTEIEQDALAEIANMGVSRAANSLRLLVGEEVLLSVPSVRIVTREAASKLVERENAKKLVAVRRQGAIDLSGSAKSGAGSLDCRRRALVGGCH